MTHDKDKVKRLELTEDLTSKYGIIDVYYNSERIEIMYTRIDGKDDVIRLQVGTHGSETINQLDSLINGSMNLEAFTHLKWHLTKELFPIWDQIYIPYNAEADDERRKEEEDPQKTKTEIALEVCKKNISRLFTDEYKTAYVAIQIKDHLEAFRINSNSFKNWVRKINYQENNKILDTQTIVDICGLLSANAEYDGNEITLSLRTALINDEWYYDLTNKNWEFVKITSNSWFIVKNEIIFRRYSNQQAQVYASREYEPEIFDEFMKLINIKASDEDSKLLLKVYIVTLFIPEIQKVILMLQGTQGSAKSFLEELIKMAVDPSILKTLVLPRDINELIQQLSHNYVGYYDNVSKIPDWISDQLCRVTSGSGSSKRQLYTDDDVIRSFKRCVGFNGINLGATKADLLDRGLIIKLESIHPKKRRTPSEEEIFY